MDYNLLINGVYWGYNPLTNILLTSWDIRIATLFSGLLPIIGAAARNSGEKTFDGIHLLRSPVSPRVFVCYAFTLCFCLIGK